MMKEIYKNIRNFYSEVQNKLKYQLQSKFFGSQGLENNNVDGWKKNRKIINPAFNQVWSTSIIGFCAKQVIDKISDKTKNVKFHNLMQDMTLDALGQILFEYDFEAVKTGNNKNFKLYLDVSHGVFDPVYNLFPFLDLLPIKNRTTLFKKLDKFNEFIYEVIEKRKEQLKTSTEKKTDLLSLLVEATMNGQMSQQELRNNFIGFFLAGHDTTASTLASISYFLCKHKDIQTKLRKEIVDVMGDKKDVPTTEQLKEMKYMDLVIRESMRIITIAQRLGRYVAQDYTFSNGFKVKKGESILIDNYSLHHNEKIYPKPYEFDPSRFSSSSDNKDAPWMPFGGGPRICVGMNFSYTEQKVLLSMILLEFNMSFSTERNEEFPKLVPYGTSAPQDLLINFEKRN